MTDIVFGVSIALLPVSAAALVVMQISFAIQVMGISTMGYGFAVSVIGPLYRAAAVPFKKTQQRLRVFFAIGAWPASCPLPAPRT